MGRVVRGGVVVGVCLRVAVAVWGVWECGVSGVVGRVAVCGREGVWPRGTVGVWGAWPCGRVGVLVVRPMCEAVWQCGRVGVWPCGSVGVWP